MATMKETKNGELKSLLKENKKRIEKMYARFNPITGEGSVGERFLVVLEDFPYRKQWLPVSMKNNKVIKSLVKYKGISGFIENVIGEEDSEENRNTVIDMYIRIRSLYDFPFWAATFCKIKNKKVGEPDCLFRLTYPQRKFVALLEGMRLQNKPIRVILLKARQWGGSTTSQLYMSWLQLVHKQGLNSLIISNFNKGAEVINGMFKKMIEAYPVKMLHEAGEQYSENEDKYVSVGRSGLSKMVPQRNCTISIGSAESPDSCRGGDYALVHLSEVGLWKATEGKKPEDIVRSACSGVLYKPYTMIVYESTANGVGNFFHKEYVSACSKIAKSQFSPLFISWFDIEMYQLGFATDAEKEKFALWLLENKNGQQTQSDREEPGKYLWSLWESGASLEGIHWYVEERTKFNDHGQMASEYPSDDIEAFVNSGSAVFDKYQVYALRQSTIAPPLHVGDIYGYTDTGEDSLRELRFKSDAQGILQIWQMPDNDSDSDDFVSDRYIAVVDVGGRSNKADYSVIVVFDRLAMIDGGKPAVVAQWYGHIDMDLLAWKAAQIASFYDDALLVIESNTLETHDRNRDVDGDQSQAILAQIKDVYPNLYARKQSEDVIRNGKAKKYGFHTNVSTKPMIISTLVKVIREGMYVERDSRCIDEYLNYEKKPNGSFGAKEGTHDDLLMTRAIGLHICFYEMPMPAIVSKSNAPHNFNSRVLSAASM